MSMSATYDSAGRKAPGSSAPRACTRCRIPATLTSRGLGWCRGCLLTSIAGKVRTHLSESAAVGQSVTVALSGGPGSLLLFDVVARMMDCGRKRRLFSDALAVVVDTRTFPAPLLDASAETAGLRVVLVNAASAGFRVILAPAEAAFASGAVSTHFFPIPVPPVRLPTGPDASSGPPAHAPRRPVYDAHEAAEVEAAVDSALASVQAAQGPGGVLEPAAAALLDAFSACTSRDARQDLAEAVTSALMRSAAVAHCAPFILVGTTCSRAAALVLARACKGRGLSIPLDVAPADFRHWLPEPTGEAPAAHSGVPTAASAASATASPLPSPWYPCPPVSVPRIQIPPPARGGCVLLRPLLDVEAAEAALYSRLLGLPVLAPAASFAVAAACPPRSSIDAAVEAVLAGLQASFENTVHNVVRTARKLEAPVHAQRGPPTLAEQQQSEHLALPEEGADVAEGEEEEEEGEGGVLEGGSETGAAPPPPSLCALCGGLLPLSDDDPDCGNATALPSPPPAAACGAAAASAPALPDPGAAVESSGGGPPVGHEQRQQQRLARGRLSAALCRGCRVSLLETRCAPPPARGRAAGDPAERAAAALHPSRRGARGRGGAGGAAGAAVEHASLARGARLLLAPGATQALPTFALAELLRRRGAASAEEEADEGEAAAGRPLRALTREEMRARLEGCLL